MKLSEPELKVIENKDFFVVRARVNKKILRSLEQIQDNLKELYGELSKDHILHNYTSVPAKISKGENYKDLPYYVLDFPRHFKEQDTCAVRYMLLWGNFFSATLQLSGEIHKKMMEVIVSHYSQLVEGDFYICVNANPWEYHYSEDNYQQIQQLAFDSFRDLVRNKPFIKLSKYIKIQEIDNMNQFATQTSRDFFSILC